MVDVIWSVHAFHLRAKEDDCSLLIEMSESPCIASHSIYDLGTISS